MAGLSTPLTDALGIDVPIVQAPIGSATCPPLVTGVADAGALGMLAVTWCDESTTRKLLAEIETGTDGRFGINIVADESASEFSTDAHVETCLDEGVDIFSFSFGDAAPFVDRIHATGGTVLQSVGSAEQARNAVVNGVDIVVAQGWEAGGHVQSDVATMPLVPRVADAVPDTPVVAAGGIADGRGIAAALSLGADGAWLGTRFLATKEAHVHRKYRSRVLEANETETVHSTLFDDGWPDVPHRVIENSTVEEWMAAGEPETDRPGDRDIVAEAADEHPVRRYEDSLAVPGMGGDVEALPLYAGQSVGVTETVRSAGELVSLLAEETTDALERVNDYRTANE
ncbi:nitronate monooxygenase (plasmid) [Haladaptatus sp. SPP-AMP-3]|uniref:NAD(P)H-dependent flavin oxidoreductase n=1 Tax=Haladaptatus sp. SPP-AMP-3 TaxID=3121295 RepID=UPI003C2EC02C